MKRALITGITGQDGSYLAELLLAKGYEVHGVVRRVALEDPDHRMNRLRAVLHDVRLHAASLESYPSLFEVVRKVEPDEIYHLAAQSFVSYSFEDEFSTLTTNIGGTHYMLSAARNVVPDCRFYFAGSSEMFGKVRETPQNETTAFHPRSAYGISKVAGYDLARNYREAYGLRVSCGILYNHESPRRGLEFVTRKITSGVAAIRAGRARELRLGNLDARRDWGFAGEFVEAMHRMQTHPEPGDFVVATGRTHSVREFAEKAFARAGLDWKEFVRTDPTYFRPAEVDLLLGDASKARKVLGWRPRVDFDALVAMMVDADLEAQGARRGVTPRPSRRPPRRRRSSSGRSRPR